MNQFDHTPYIKTITDAEHVARKVAMVEAICRIWPGPFQRILDIGSGVAHESRELQRRFGSDLWLVEGTRANNDKKLPTAGKAKYHMSAEDFLYYWDLSVLDQELQRLGTGSYHLVDCDHIDIPADVNFDLITSWKSCGYHYPVDTYRDLIRQHSHADTVIIMDLRIYKGAIRLDLGWSIVREISRQGNKRATCQIKIDD